MLKIIIVVLGVIAMAALLLVPRVRVRLLEGLKAVSDIAVIFFLRLTSQFESELTEEGKAEQQLWRERRLRNLQGLALRSRQRWGEKSK